jgi:hypothetical protein
LGRIRRSPRRDGCWLVWDSVGRCKIGELCFHRPLRSRILFSCRMRIRVIFR